MSLDVLNKQIVLSLNRAWQPLGFVSPKKAVVSIFSESEDENASMPLDIEMDEEGNIVYAAPVSLEDWLKLPIRSYDLSLRSAHQEIRVPTVIVSMGCNKMPIKNVKLGRSAIYERDGGVCQYSGEYVGRQGNLDHITPKDRGGRDSFENMVWCKREINSNKGNRLNHEAGLKLIRPAKMPPGMPVSATIKEPRHPTQKPFIIVNK